MKKAILTASICTLALSLISCGNKDSQAQNSTATQEVKVTYQKKSPDFNEQNAYNNINAQVKFGPRVPGTPAQKETAAWLESELKKYADQVTVQKTEVIAGDKKTKLPCYNIFGQFNTDATQRILLLSHWDSRPWADMDFKERDKAIDGADDGASGVGVLLEIARLIKENKLPEYLGVDILFVDVEDYGKGEWGSDSYALGSQYFAKNPIIKGYAAQAGILLDMVGGKNAEFPMEGYSMQYARNILNDVWNLGHQLGYGKYFVYKQSGAITDDHVPINQYLKVPTIDIINLPPNSQTGFVGHWHTHDDKIENIDPATLKAVGQTVAEYLYTR